MQLQPKSVSVRDLWKRRHFRYLLAAFVAVNGALYLWMGFGHGLVPFSNHGYQNAYHYNADQRTQQPPSFNLLNALAQYDAQWYIKAGTIGYPTTNGRTWSIPFGQPVAISTPQALYAFPPVYPILLWLVGCIVGSTLLGAFLLTQILLVADFWAVYWLVTRWYSERLAARTAWLVFLYPLSIFYRSYFSEGLFLLLLVVVLDALGTKRWVRAAAAAGVLGLIRLAGLPATLVALYGVWHERPLARRRVLTCVGLTILPLAVFSAYCYSKTGNPLYYLIVRRYWHQGFIGSLPPLLWSILHIWQLPFHTYHLSLLDTLSDIVFGCLIWLSRRWLPKPWWFVALGLWLFPILTTDTMSASRYQIVNLPLFLYVAQTIRGRWFTAAAVACAAGLAVVSLLFINWYWIG